MKKYSLKFNDANDEEKFQNENHPLILSKFILFFNIYLGYVILHSLYKLIVDYNEINLMLMIIFVLAMCFMYLIRNRFKKLYEIIIFGACMGIGIIFVEFTKYTKLEENIYRSEGFLLVLTFQFYLSINLTTNANWLFISCFFIFNFIYFLVRLIDFNNLIFGFITYSGCLLILVSYTLIAYKQERANRINFLNKEIDNKNLVNFKILLENILPYPIFIIDKSINKIEFMNQSAFDVIEKQLDIDELKNFPSENGQKSIKYPPTSFLKNKRRKKVCKYEVFEKLLESFKLIEKKNMLVSQKVKSLADIISEDYYHKTKIFSKPTNKNILFTTLSLYSQHSNINNSSILNKKDKNLVYFELKYARIIWEGKICLLLILFDNSNLIKVRELENLDKYKNRMLSTISHDLRTPLNGIMGMISTVASQINDNELKKSLNIGLRSTLILNYLINDILDFTLIASGKFQFHFEKFRIKTLIYDMRKLFKFQAKKKGIEFIINNNTIHKFINSDFLRIKQILVNLLSNGLKFTAKNGKLILNIEDHSPSILKISVQDTGIGIKKSKLSSLFYLFGLMNLEDDDFNEEINKTGIGLGLTVSNYLARNLCNYSKNSQKGLNVDSECEKGTIFWFYIDINEVDEDSIIDIDEEIEGSPRNKINSTFRIKNFERPNNVHNQILVVDDDLINLLVLEKYMNYFKLSYLTAMNGEEALKIIELDDNQNISCIFMDCNMPVMDGFKATEKINEFLKLNNKNMIPIVAVTANVTVDDKEMCLKAGMIGCLTKPVSRKVIGETINELLNLDLVF